MKKTLNIWTFLGITLIAAIGSAAITGVLLISFEKIKPLILWIGAAVWLTGLSCTSMYINKKLSNKKQAFIIIGIHYALFLLSLLCYPAGFFWWISMLGMMTILFIANAIHTDSLPILLFYNINTLFSMSMAATFNGLMYARYISSDWGTLYLTFIAGLSFAVTGFILSAITLLEKRSNSAPTDSETTH